MSQDSDPDRPLPPVGRQRNGFSAVVAGTVRHLLRPSVRIGILATMGYVCGLVGLALSFRGDPADPQGVYGVLGIALMAVAFTCLFLVSLGLVNASGGGSGPRLRRKR